MHDVACALPFKPWTTKGKQGQTLTNPREGKAGHASPTGENQLSRTKSGQHANPHQATHTSTDPLGRGIGSRRRGLGRPQQWRGCHRPLPTPVEGGEQRLMQAHGCDTGRQAVVQVHCTVQSANAARCCR